MILPPTNLIDRTFGFPEYGHKVGLRLGHSFELFQLKCLHTYTGNARKLDLAYYSLLRARSYN